MTDSETQFSNIINIITKYQNKPASLVRNEFAEDNVMSVLFSNSFNITEFVSYFLKYQYTNVYDDIAKNIKYYDADFKIINEDPVANENIINVDMSYYCSQDVNKYIFLLDVLSEIYKFRSKHKSNDGNITIRTRYIINSDNNWIQDNTGKIHTFAIQYKYDRVDGASTYFIEDKMYSVMCNIFQKDIIKHLNYLNKVDIANGNIEYLNNIYLFYVFCRLKLILYILMCCSEVNKTVQKFINEKIAFCFINLKNDILINNENNKSIILTQKFINTTDQLNKIRTNVDKNNLSIKRLKTKDNYAQAKYDDSKTILYICLLTCVCFAVLTVIVYNIDSNIKHSIFSKPLMIVYVVLIYIIFSFVIYTRNTRTNEHFENKQKPSGLNWNKYQMIQTDLTLYPREPMSNFTKTYVDKTNVRCRSSSHLTLEYRAAYNMFNRNKYKWIRSYPNAGTAWVSADNYCWRTGISRAVKLYFNNDMNYYGDFCILDLGEKILLKKYVIYPIDDTNCGFGQSCYSYGPKNFRIYATNDHASYDNIKSGKWVLIDERTNYDYYNFPNHFEFDLSQKNSTLYQYYAIIVNSIHSCLESIKYSNRCVVISEWELFGIPEKLVEKSKGKGEHLESGIVVNTSQIQTTEYSIMDYMGYFYTKNYSGDFTFYINSDKDSYLHIGSKLVIDNNEMDGIRERSGTVRLEANTYYPFNARINNPKTTSIFFSHANIPKTSNGDGHYFPYYEDGLVWERKTGYQNYDNGLLIDSGKNVNILNMFTGSGELYNVEFNGWFFTRKYSGNFTFYTNSDDESFIWIANTLVVNNQGLHPAQERSGVINLKADTFYPIKIRFGNNRGPGVLSVYFSHANIPKTSNGNGYFYNTELYDKYYDSLVIEYEEVKKQMEHKLKMAEEAAQKAQDELKKKADLEKQYADELKQLNNELEQKKQQNADLMDEIQKNEQEIIEKDIEIKRLWLKLASEEKERLRINAEFLKQKAMKEAQMLTEQQLKEDLEDYKQLSIKIQNLRTKLEVNKQKYADSINKEKMDLERATLVKDEEAAKLLAARIQELSLKTLIQEEEMINREASAELEQHIRNTELAKKATEEAILEKERLDQLGLELTSVDVQHALAEVARKKADQRKMEQILLTQESKIKAKLATDIAYARKMYYKKLQIELNAMVLEFESNESEIDKLNIEIQNLDDKLKTLTQELGNEKQQIITDEELLKEQIKKNEAEMRRDILNTVKSIDDLKRQIDINIKKTLDERNAIIDTNKQLKETAMAIFKENYELEQYKFISQQLSVDNSIRDIKTKLFYNIDNIVLMIANSLVATGLDKELKDMMEVDRLSDNMAHRGENSIDILMRDSKIMDATTKLILHFFALAIIIFVLNDILSTSSKLSIFGTLYIIALAYYIYEVMIIVQTKSSKKYWKKPTEDILLNSA